MVEAIVARQYMNKPTVISRVLLDSNGKIISGFVMPVRTARAISHDLDVEGTEPEIILSCDTAIGEIDESNPYLVTDQYHQTIQPGDRIMRLASRTRLWQSGEEDTEPYAMPVVYGESYVEPVHAGRYITYDEEEAWIGNMDNRWYRTVFILGISIGECEEVDLTSILWEEARLNLSPVPGGDGLYANGEWSGYVRDDSNNQQDALTDPNLEFIREHITDEVREWLTDMYGRGMTILFLRREHKQHREEGYEGGLDETVNFQVRVRGRSVFDRERGSLLLVLTQHFNSETIS